MSEVQAHRVVVVEDHPVTAEGIKSNLEVGGDIKVAATFMSGNGLLDQLISLNPDLLCLDLKVPQLEPLQLVRLVRQQLPKMKVVVLTAYDHPDFLAQLLEQGVTGIMLKSDMQQSPHHMVKEALAGRRYLSPKVSAMRLGHALSEDLTTREWEVVALVRQGKSNADIAEALVLSRATVSNYVSAIAAKLGVGNRAGIATWATTHPALPSYIDGDS